MSRDTKRYAHSLLTLRESLPCVHLVFDPRDLWLGVYWNRQGTPCADDRAVHLPGAHAAPAGGLDTPGAMRGPGMTLETFSALMLSLAEVYDCKLSAPALEAYFEDFGHLDEQTFRLALRHARRSAQRFPTPRDLFDAVRLVQSATGAGLPSGEEVWGRVKRAIARYADETRNTAAACGLTEAEAAALREVGTLRELAWMSERDLEFRRRDFLAAYERRAGRAALGLGEGERPALRLVGGE